MDWATTERNGIKFSHPGSMVILETPPPDWVQGYWEGGLQGEDSSQSLVIIGLFWVTDGESEINALETVLEIAQLQNPGLES